MLLVICSETRLKKGLRMDMLVFWLLIALSVIISGIVSFEVSGPGIVGVCGACLPLMCGVPSAFFLFLNPTFNQKFQGKLRYILPAVVPILFASILIGLSLYDQNPRVMFKRLLSDPIPAGVSNIRSYDNSGGFDVEYGLAFDATPEVVDYLISKNGLTLDNDNSNFNRDNAPFENFPEVKREQEWSYYSKIDREHNNSWYMWVNVDKTTVLFIFIGG